MAFEMGFFGIVTGAQLQVRAELYVSANQMQARGLV